MATSKAIFDSRKKSHIEKSIKLDVKRRSVLAKKSLIRAQEKKHKAFQVSFKRHVEESHFLIDFFLYI